MSSPIVSKGLQFREEIYHCIEEKYIGTSV